MIYVKDLKMKCWSQIIQVRAEFSQGSYKEGGKKIIMHVTYVGTEQRLQERCDTVSLEDRDSSHEPRTVRSF